MKPIADLREEYKRAALDEHGVAKDWFEQFEHWFTQAQQAGLREPNAMTLATVDEHAQPHARIVLLKDVSAEGFVFYTNADSAKGLEMARSPRVALVFFWAELERQVRVEGAVSRVADVTADAYFASRPRGSQLGAWASRQSSIIPSRQVLDEALRQVSERFLGREVPRPPGWGGFRVAPSSVEFWQGRPNRLHDRLRYKDIDGAWRLERLSP